MNRIRRLLVLLPATLLSGCGFTLRGASDWPSELDPIYIDGLDARDPLYLLLVQNLRAAGADVLENPSPVAAELRVLSLREHRRVLSVTSAARISEYELIRVLDAELRLPDAAEPLPLGRLEASRIYVFDAASVLTRSEREEELGRAMDRDLLRMLNLRVQAALRGRHGEGRD
ncbi:LPS assembly lipoprotein LptE [Thioalkalivibrio sp.]|uniref:LPS-assembly lipoprotein LptE n=1 Tax=Thioalkalivibrio sp. TaxID=2093813 RepID=UPI0039747D63